MLAELDNSEKRPTELATEKRPHEKQIRSLHESAKKLEHRRISQCDEDEDKIDPNNIHVQPRAKLSKRNTLTDCLSLNLKAENLPGGGTVRNTGKVHPPIVS